MSTSERNTFVRTVLDLYLGLPHSGARRPSPHDRRLAEQLFDRRVPLELIQAALILAILRRSTRSTAPPLPPVRSLHYFLPLINELVSLHHLIPTTFATFTIASGLSPIDQTVIFRRFLMVADT